MSLLTSFNQFVTQCFDHLFRPIEQVSVLWALVICAAVIGLIASLIIRFTTNQVALEGCSRQFRACLLGMRLFPPDLSTAIRCHSELLRTVGRRLLLSVTPMLVMAPLFVIVIAQLQARFEYRPIASDEIIVAELVLSDTASPAETHIQLLEPQADLPPLYDPQRNATTWRLKTDQPRTLALRWQVGNAEISHPVAVGRDRLMAVAPNRRQAFFADQLMHPTALPIPSGVPIEAITIHYPKRHVTVLGLTPRWWLPLIMISMASTWLFARLTGTHL